MLRRSLDCQQRSVHVTQYCRHLTAIMQSVTVLVWNVLVLSSQLATMPLPRQNIPIVVILLHKSADQPLIPICAHFVHHVL